MEIYEKTKVMLRFFHLLKDQQAIQKLRERVTQLDLENTALARAAHGGVSNDNDSTTSSDDSNLDVQALVDKITRLKGMVKLANERSEKPVNIDGKFYCFKLIQTRKVTKLYPEDTNGSNLF